MIKKYTYPTERAGNVGVARLCRWHLGLGKKETLDILNLTHSNENFWWLEDVTTLDEGY